MILDYVMKYHLLDCINILHDTDVLGYFSLKIDFLKLFESYPDVGDKVLCSPINSLPACNNAIIKVQQSILDQDSSKLEYYFLKRNVSARFFGLPVCPELHRTIFPKNVDLGCFLKVTGTVVRVTQSKMLEYQRRYVCMKCKFENTVEAHFENRYILKAPSKCGNDIGCKCTQFTQVNMVSREHCKDYQEIKIQEQVNKLSIGSIPGSMWVVLENDLVDSCKPGDDVNICGTVRRRWRPTGQNKKSEVELVFQANYLEVCNAQRGEAVAAAPDVKDCFNEYWNQYEQCPLKGRDQILMSVCPQVYGLHLVKLAVLLTVITGSDHTATCSNSQQDEKVTRIRQQCHLLLVGDPGTGKSQLLSAAASLSGRAVLASGAGSSRAGLTCAALREDGEWQLEAGALVLADGGVCCVDELGQLKDTDRTAIHEAMEQQTISIAKAGIVCKLNSRCAVVAACNPRGHYDRDQPLSRNVALGTPLLSRFDLIFVLLDSKNKAWDELVSSYILFGGSEASPKKQWTLEKLQLYISLSAGGAPQSSPPARAVVGAYYRAARRAGGDPARITVRLLDSLVRLSEAHCKLMHRSTVLTMDAVVAVSLVDLSMQDCALNDNTNALHSTFPKYPDFEYLCTAKKLLTKLSLFEIWQEELIYYGKLLQVDFKTLETAVNEGDCRLFAKFDDLADESIPLSASLVTSSYFNGKRVNNDIQNVIDQDNDNEVNNRLATTLKKHADLNKGDTKVPEVQKKTAKRKRKEVIIDTSKMVKENPKKVLKKSGKNKVNKATDDSTSEDENIDNSKILNAVPSVNDFFTELGIDLKFDSDCDGTNTEEIDRKPDLIKHSTQIEEISNENREQNDKKDAISNCNTSMNARSKLEQFKFGQNHDSSKYEEKVKKKKESICVKSREEKQSSNASCDQKSVQSSQISIFESSDCDIDLDL